MNETTTVELARGIADDEGRAHKTVVLRAPTVDDEVKAEAELVKLRNSQDKDAKAEGETDALYRAALTLQCIVSAGPLKRTHIKLHQIRALGRGDYQRLVGAIMQLEAALEAAHSGNDSGEESETSSGGTEPPASPSES